MYRPLDKGQPLITPLQNFTNKVLFLTMPGTYHRFQHSDNSKTIDQRCITNVLIETNHLTKIVAIHLGKTHPNLEMVYVITMLPLENVLESAIHLVQWLIKKTGRVLPGSECVRGEQNF